MLIAWLKATWGEFAFKRDNRVLIALVYCNGMAALGLAISSLGPALLSLAEQTQSSLTATGYCFGARSFGYLIGSFGGPLFDRVPGHYALSGGLMLAGVGGLLIPAASSVYALGATVSLQGFAMGFLDTGANVLLIYQFGQEVGPWMQLMHSAFAVGAFLGPMLLRAVAHNTLPVDNGQHEVSSGPGSYNGAFFTIGTYSVLLAVTLVFLQSPKARGAKAAESPTEAPNDQARVDMMASVGNEQVDFANLTDVDVDVARGPSEHRQECSNAPADPVVDKPTEPAPEMAQLTAAATAAQKWRRLKLVLVLALLLGVYVGCEAGYGAFLTAYDVVALGQTEAQGQLMTGAYWGAFMVGRLSGVPISLYLKPAKYLGISMAGCVAACILLLLGRDSVPVMWVGTILYGLFMACVFPTAIALAETYFPVHGSDATAFVVGSATGEWLLPFLISTLFGGVPGEAEIASSSGPSVGPVILMWVISVGCIVNIAIYFLLTRKGKEYKQLYDAPAAQPSASNVSTVPA
jgi:FHS family Na+ dependent glucose MFS transporter 1